MHGHTRREIGLGATAAQERAHAAGLAGRIRGQIERGPSISVTSRLWLAFGGGMMSGFAARLARGCTSGQALTGASELALGSWIFMFCIFGGAYATAYFFRKEWL